MDSFTLLQPPPHTPTSPKINITDVYFSMDLVATEDSNPIYSAYGITFSAQTTPQYQDPNFYSELMLVPASAVHKDLDTS